MPPLNTSPRRYARDRDGRNSLYSPAQWAWVAERYLEGYPVNTLAEFLGFSAKWLHMMFKAMGVPRRGRARDPLKSGMTLASLEGRKREFYALIF